MTDGDAQRVVIHGTFGKSTKVLFENDVISTTRRRFSIQKHFVGDAHNGNGFSAYETAKSYENTTCHLYVMIILNTGWNQHRSWCDSQSWRIWPRLRSAGPSCNIVKSTCNKIRYANVIPASERGFEFIPCEIATREDARLRTAVCNAHSLYTCA